MRDYSDLDPRDYNDPSPQEQMQYDYNYIDDKLSTDKSKAENYIEWVQRDMPIDGYRREDALDFLLTQFDKAITPVLATIDERFGNKLKEFDLSKFFNAYFEEYTDYIKSKKGDSQSYALKHKGYSEDDPRYEDHIKNDLRIAGVAYFSNSIFYCICCQIGIAELLEEQLKSKEHQLLATIFNQVNKYNVDDFLYAPLINYVDKAAEKEQSFRQLLINGLFEDMSNAYENPVNNEEWFDFVARNSEMVEKMIKENKINLIENGENKQLTLTEISRLVAYMEYNNEPINIKAIAPEKELEKSRGLTL